MDSADLCFFGGFAVGVGVSLISLIIVYIGGRMDRLR